MGIFGSLFGRSQPQKSPAPAKKVGPEIFALILLRQMVTRFEIEQDDFDRMMKVVDVELRPLVREWIVIYVAWVLWVLARAEYGARFIEDALSAMSRVAAEAPHPESMKTVEESLRFWLPQLDKDAYGDAYVVKGVEVPKNYFMAVRFLALDPRSPYHMKEELPETIDWDVARALGAANDAMVPYVKRVIATIEPLSR